MCNGADIIGLKRERAKKAQGITKSTGGKKLAAILLALTVFFSFGACAKDNADPAKDLKSLSGHVVYNIGKGAVPDLTFRYLLKANELSYELGDTPKEGVVRLAYPPQGANIGTLLEAGTAKYIIAAEPSVSNILATVEGSKILIDLQEQYNVATKTNGSFPQACLVVKKSFYEANPDYVNAFVTAMQNGTEWAANNVETAKAALIAAGSKTMNNLTKESAQRSNVVFKAASDNRAMIEAYFNNISNVGIGDEPSPIGGKLPSDGFYGAIPSEGSNLTATAKVYVPDGSPVLSIAKLINDGFNGATFNIVAANQIDNAIVQGLADIAVMPLTSAANLYNKEAAIKMLAVVTSGSLYMLTK